MSSECSRCRETTFWNEDADRDDPSPLFNPCAQSIASEHWPPQTAARSMTLGEKLIWATAFATAIGHSCKGPVAVRIATRAVRLLREVEADQLPDGEREAVEQMRGDHADP